MRPPRALLAVVGGLVLGLGASACGGESDEDKAKGAVEDYLAAVTDGDGDKACGLVTEQTRKNIERGGRSCPETISSLNKGPGKQILKAFENAKVEDVKVNGERATANIVVRGLKQPTQLRKEKGDWKLDSAGAGVG